MPKVCIHCLPEEKQILSINITALESIAEYFFQAGIESAAFSKEKRQNMLNRPMTSIAAANCNVNKSTLFIN